MKHTADAHNVFSELMTTTAEIIPHARQSGFCCNLGDVAASRDLESNASAVAAFPALPANFETGEGTRGFDSEVLF
jgi:hypothetical protein